jgi:hypothetical protein
MGDERLLVGGRWLRKQALVAFASVGALGEESDAQCPLLQFGRAK